MSCKKLFIPFAHLSLLLTGVLLWQFSFDWWEVPRVALCSSQRFLPPLQMLITSSSLGRGKWKHNRLAAGARGLWTWSFLVLFSVRVKKTSSLRIRLGTSAHSTRSSTIREDLLIMEGDTLDMGEYFVSYRDRYY